MRGPYSFYSASNANPYVNKIWYRTNIGQKVRTPLPYNHFECRGTIHPLLYSSPPEGYSAIFMPARFASFAPFGVDTRDPGPFWNKALAKLKDKSRSSVQGGVDWAERHQTLRMINSALSALRSPLKSFSEAARRYSKDPNKALLKDLPDAWLAWHFGVKPLIQSLHDLLKRLSESGKPRLVSASTRDRGSYIKGYYADGNLRGNYNTVYRYSAYFTRTDETLASLNDFGILNPAEVFWELVPYSFVADWFFPIGQFIRSMTDSAGYSVTNAYRTVYSTSQHVYVPTRIPPSSAFFPANYSSNVINCYSVRRELLSNLIPTVTTTPQGWSSSMERAWTTSSLLMQILNRH